MKSWLSDTHLKIRRNGNFWYKIMAVLRYKYILASRAIQESTDALITRSLCS